MAKSAKMLAVVELPAPMLGVSSLAAGILLRKRRFRMPGNAGGFSVSTVIACVVGEVGRGRGGSLGGSSAPPAAVLMMSWRSRPSVAVGYPGEDVERPAIQYGVAVRIEVDADPVAAGAG